MLEKLTYQEWVKVLENNYDDIHEQILTAIEEAEGNRDVNVGVAIEPSGNIYQWKFVGDGTQPEDVWNGIDLEVVIIKGWLIEDCFYNESNETIFNYIKLYNGQYPTGKKNWQIMRELIKSGDYFLTFLENNYPKIGSCVHEELTDNDNLFSENYQQAEYYRDRLIDKTKALAEDEQKRGDYESYCKSIYGE